MARINFNYVNAAKQMGEKGDFVSALHYYFLQRNSRESAELDVDIANTYMAMGILNEAIRYYMRAYDKDNDCTEALAGLSYAFKDIDEDASYIYLNRLINLGDEMDIDFDYGEPEFPAFEVHDRRDKSEVMDSAIEQFESGKTDEAIATLKSIDKDSYQYCDAVLARASIELDNGEVTEALRLADEGLAVDQLHVGLHILKLMAFDAQDDYESLTIWADKLDKLNITDEEELAKVAMCFINYGEYNRAEKYILRKLKSTPYDKFMLLGLCSVLTAKGDNSGAIAAANKVCTIYPDDIEVKELSGLVFEGKPFRLPEEIYNLKKRFINEIKDIFLTNTDITSPENFMRIKWLLQGDNDLYLQSAVCAYVTCMPEYDRLMNDTLIDPFAPTIVKKQILLRRVCDESVKRVKFVISDIYRSIKVRHPDVEENLKAAYYYVFIALAVSEMDFERRLGSAMKKLSATFMKYGNPDLPAGGLAVMLYLMTEGEDEEKALDLFDCSRETYDLVVNTLNPRR